MRKLNEYPVLTIFLAAFLIIGISVCIMKGCTHDVTYEGVVISHNVTSDRAGNIGYFTIVEFNDGTVRSLRGLTFYVKPIGSTIHYTTRVFD